MIDLLQSFGSWQCQNCISIDGFLGRRSRSVVRGARPPTIALSWFLLHYRLHETFKVSKDWLEFLTSEDCPDSRGKPIWLKFELKCVGRDSQICMHTASCSISVSIASSKHLQQTGRAYLGKKRNRPKRRWSEPIDLHLLSARLMVMKSFRCVQMFKWYSVNSRPRHILVKADLIRIEFLTPAVIREMMHMIH